MGNRFGKTQKYLLDIYVVIPFEIKIGLLKFICDYLKVNLQNEIVNVYEDEKWCKELNELCPKEFLNSIFK